MKTIVFRADASTAIGSGHFMRCLALGQAWADSGGETIFITNCQDEGLLQRLEEEKFQIHTLSQSYPAPGDWEYTKGILAGNPGAWLVLDGYLFDETYQQHVKNSGHRLLVTDDMAHLKHYYADIILNQNLSAEKLRYSYEPGARLLLGTQYVLLRREFLAWRGWKREIPEVARRVLVTLGGADPDNISLRVVQALQQVNVADLDATLVVGASNPHVGTLEAAARQGRIPIRITRDARNMPELMAGADVGISAAGSTCLEIAYMGLPNMTIVLADNQEKIAQAVQEQGLAINLGWHQAIEPDTVARVVTDLAGNGARRGEMSRRGRQLIDGDGAFRVLSVMSAGAEA